jgi:hypothetical protein
MSYKYTMAILRDDKIIVTMPVEADAIIDLLAGTKIEVVDEGQPVKTPTKAKGKGCKSCGSPSRHKKGCELAPGAKEVSSLPRDTKRDGALNKDQFEKVRLADKNGIPSDSIANTLGLKKKEVDKAIIAYDYENYSSI